MNKTDNSLVVPVISKECDVLHSGEFLECGKNTVKDKKQISFICNLDVFGKGAVRIGQGYSISNAAWLEIKKNKVSAFLFYSYTNPNLVEILPPTDLGFEITDFLSVTVNVDYASSETFARITSVNGSVKIPIPRFLPSDGAVFASPVGLDLTNCKLNSMCNSYSYDVWIFGDSYLGFTHGARWPYYLYQDGYTELLLSGYAGMSTPRGLEDFKTALKFGSPVYAVWCLGMNNGDRKDVEKPNDDWLKSTEEFLSLCKENHIIPILSTIPETPKVHNAEKNRWVRSSSYRYIDFEKAVGADKKASWYEGMLFSDNVHPSSTGASALYARVLVDFPEIMSCR